MRSLDYRTGVQNQMFLFQLFGLVPQSLTQLAQSQPVFLTKAHEESHPDTGHKAGDETPFGFDLPVIHQKQVGISP